MKLKECSRSKALMYDKYSKPIWNFLFLYLSSFLFSQQTYSQNINQQISAINAIKKENGFNFSVVNPLLAQVQVNVDTWKTIVDLDLTPVINSRGEDLVQIVARYSTGILYYNLKTHRLHFYGEVTISHHYRDVTREYRSRDYLYYDNQLQDIHNSIIDTQKSRALISRTVQDWPYKYNPDLQTLISRKNAIDDLISNGHLTTTYVDTIDDQIYNRKILLGEFTFRNAKGTLSYDLVQERFYIYRGRLMRNPIRNNYDTLEDAYDGVRTVLEITQ